MYIFYTVYILWIGSLKDYFSRWYRVNCEINLPQSLCPVCEEIHIAKRPVILFVFVLPSSGFLQGNEFSSVLKEKFPLLETVQSEYSFALNHVNKINEIHFKKSMKETYRYSTCMLLGDALRHLNNVKGNMEVFS